MVERSAEDQGALDSHVIIDNLDGRHDRVRSVAPTWTTLLAAPLRKSAGSGYRKPGG